MAPVAERCCPIFFLFVYFPSVDSCGRIIQLFKLSALILIFFLFLADVSKGYSITTGFIHLIGSLRSDITLHCFTVKFNKVVRPLGLVCHSPVLNVSQFLGVHLTLLRRYFMQEAFFFFVCFFG